MTFGTNVRSRKVVARGSVAFIVGVLAAAFLSTPVQAADGDERQVDIALNAGADGPSWTPDSRALVYRSAQFEIRRHALDEEQPTTVYRGDQQVGYPSVSRDGRYVVFWQGATWGSPSHLRVLNLAERSVRVLPNPPGVTDQGAADWSPDATQLVYSARVDAGENADWRTYDWRIYIANSDGSNARQLTDTRGQPVRGTGPKWSPDGRTIAIGGRELVLVDVDGSHKRVVGTDALDPGWSPDGQQLIVGKKQVPGPLAIVSASATGEQLLSGGDGQNPSWSPDGRFIAFMRGGDLWVRSLGAPIPAPPAPKPSPLPPKPGTCWRMGTRELSESAYPETSVSCTANHTVETTGTIALPPAVARFGRTSPEVAAYALRCNATTNRYTGFTSLRAWHDAQTHKRWPAGFASGVDATTFAGFAEAQPAYFVPTAAQWADGVRWVSCVAVSTSPNVNARTLESRTGTVRSKATRLRLRKSSGYAMVGMTTIAKSVSESYPGQKELARRANTMCVRVLGNAKGMWQIPSGQAWSTGTKAGRCWITLT